jgi:hypothetical protein
MLAIAIGPVSPDADKRRDAKLYPLRGYNPRLAGL